MFGAIVVKKNKTHALYATKDSVSPLVFGINFTRMIP
jgi:hypothetical protein